MKNSNISYVKKKIFPDYTRQEKSLHLVSIPISAKIFNRQVIVL